MTGLLYADAKVGINAKALANTAKNRMVEVGWSPSLAHGDIYMFSLELEGIFANRVEEPLSWVIRSSTCRTG
jgi:hypothetical protein